MTSTLHAEDRALAERMLAGDETAFDAFFGGYFPALYRFALRRLNDDPDGAEDVAQATLCRAIAKLDTYRGEAAMFTWLCTFCRHEISAFHRARSRRPVPVRLVEDDDEVAAALDSLSAIAAGDPSAAFDRDEAARIVHVALDRLPPRYAEALEWKYVDGLSVREIAHRHGSSEKAAESVLTRARDAFRDAYEVLSRGRDRTGAWMPGRT